MRTPTCGVLLLDESLADLENDPTADVGGLLITQLGTDRFYAPVAKWTHDLSVRLGNSVELKTATEDQHAASEAAQSDVSNDRFGFRAYAEAIAP